MAKGGIGDLKQQKQKREAEWQKRGEETTEAINIEMQEWQKLGIHPKNVQFDLFQIDSRLQAFIKYWIDKGYVDEVEFLELYLKPQILENLKTIRQEKLEPAIQQARMEAIAAPEAALGALPEILDHRGRPLKH